MKEAPTNLKEQLAWAYVQSAPESGEAIVWKGAKLDAFRRLEQEGFRKHKLVLRGDHSKVVVHYWWKAGETPVHLKIK